MPDELTRLWARGGLRSAGRLCPPMLHSGMRLFARDKQVRAGQASRLVAMQEARRVWV